eukprot:Hpha_TRINITY_DN17131_c0_g1::TRINITY_DN17131_c0_g1_i1::g.146738::m.146738/K05970/SIAE; sialate O-acetylesterase
MLAAVMCSILGVGPTPTLTVSAGFGSDMVLQRGRSNAIYGTVQSSHMSVGLRVEGSHTPVTTHKAAVEPQADGSGVWRVVLPPEESGSGVWNLTAYTGANESISMERVVYGDLFYCSGQSNMALHLHYTFEAESLTNAVVKEGRFGNIRFFKYGDMGIHYSAETPQWATTVGASSWYNVSYAAAVPEPKDSHGNPVLNPFHSFSATCMYFAVHLTELYGEGIAPPIGLIHTAVGGTQIEAWLDNETLTQCRNESGYEANYTLTATLFYGMVAPFANRSLRGWVWYQGENNVRDLPGNSADKLGYGCEAVNLPALWRKTWGEAVEDEAPFSLVTLAAGGDEGNPQHMAAIRWSQTGNMGTLPNKLMPNVFAAQAYDIGDPWVSNCGTCNCSSTTLNQSDSCVAWNASEWNPAVRSYAPLVANGTATPFFMGPIHPRLKSELGRRLAVAFHDRTSGPTIAGCTLESKKLALRFKGLGAERVILNGAPDMNQQDWSGGGGDSSQLMVCLGEKASVEECRCWGWDYVYDANGTTQWFCQDGTAPLPPPELIERTRRLRNVGRRPSRNPVLNAWVPVPLLENGSADTLIADLSGVANNTVLAVRYGWGFWTDSCCPYNSVYSGLQPCQPAACPIFSSDSWLPANPFFASIAADGTCECPSPQACYG